MKTFPHWTLSQERAFRYLMEGKGNLFVTGSPGTGKSFLIQQFVKWGQTKIPVVASTGAAAILIGGRTFHSFFGLGILQGGPELVFTQAMRNGRLKKRLEESEILVIDEVSMLSAEAFACAEHIARLLRQDSRPWGGMRIIAVGDFAQLPPISRRSREKEWCFLSEAWQRSEFETVQLQEVVRTEDIPFLQVLEDLRWGEVSERVKAFLDERVLDEESDKTVPHLFPRRKQTEEFNRLRLDEIESSLEKIPTEYGGTASYVERLMRDAPVPPVLELKKGAMVMLRINDAKQRFVNGTVGWVEEIEKDVLGIRIENRVIDVAPFTFTVLDEDGNEAAWARNFPVNLAYASTIHKIQGTTLDRVHIDLKNLWEPGQAYVALSRARSGSGISLTGWDQHSIRADRRVREFYADKSGGLIEQEAAV